MDATGNYSLTDETKYKPVNNDLKNTKHRNKARKMTGTKQPETPVKELGRTSRSLNDPENREGLDSLIQKIRARRLAG